MFWELVIVICIFWVVVQRWKRRKMVKLFEQFKPRSMSLPFVGHSYLFLGNGEDRMNMFKKIGEDSYDKGGLISHWQGNRLYLLVSDPVAAESILKNCLEKDDVVKIMRALLGNGSIFAPVSIWRPRRKILAPTFSVKNLNQFVSIFANQSGIMVNQLREQVGKETFSVWKYLTSYTMDSVCETTLGIKVKAQLQPDLPFLRAFEEVTHLDAERMCQPWLYNDTVYHSLPAYRRHSGSKKLICDFVKKIIQSKKQSIETDKNGLDTKPTDGLKTFLELLIESSRKNGGYGDLELQEETLVIVLAGTDTSAVGASFVSVMLSLYPDIQDKCYQELQEVFGDSDRPVSAEDLPDLKYLDAVIRETLRMYPPVPFIVRKIEKDHVLPSGVTLVEGCGIIVSIFAVHRNPDYWGEDAELFRPERFLDCSLKHPAAFMPFSYGPRACLGYQYAMMSMKTAVATLLRQYRLLPATSRSASRSIKEPLRLRFDVMMRHVDNFEVELESRHGNFFRGFCEK